MQSFNTKNSNILESFDRKFESYDTSDTRDLGVKHSDNGFIESSDQKFKGFDTLGTKDPKVERSDDEVGSCPKFQSKVWNK